MLRPDRAWK